MLLARKRRAIALDLVAKAALVEGFAYEVLQWLVQITDDCLFLMIPMATYTQ